MKSVQLFIVTAALLLLAATVTQAQVIPGVLEVTCPGGDTVIGHRLVFTSVESPRVTLTALGIADFDPVLVVIDSDGTPECVFSDNRQVGSAVAVPGLGRAVANSFTTRYVGSVQGNQLDVIVGGLAGRSGRYALVVDGMTIRPDEDDDPMRLRIPQAASGEWLGVFMFGDGSLDPMMTVSQPEAEFPLVECDNAGTSTCPASTTLADRGIQFENGDLTVGEVTDAGVLNVYRTAELIYTLGSSRNASDGPYKLLITGTAPGSLLDSSLICDNVVAGVVGASPAYNDIYAQENVLDGDPTTLWVTDNPGVDPDTEEPLERVFIVLRLDGRQRVDRIRVNGYTNQRDLANNALRAFEVVLNNPENELVTALEAEAPLQPGYQTYRFLPVELEEIGLLLKTNYGGSLFTVTDVQVCAAAPLPGG